ncbi:MAG: hypothetical protein V1781_04425 [Bacteroidota bacterium]
MTNNKKKIDALVGKHIDLKNQIKEIREQIETLEYADKHKKLEKYVGKCYVEVSRNKECHRYFYAHGINDKNCKLKVLEVSYWDRKDAYFSIAPASIFRPWKDPFYDDEISRTTYKVVSKKEFNKHYNIVLKMIEEAYLRK